MNTKLRYIWMISQFVLSSMLIITVIDRLNFKSKIVHYFSQIYDRDQKFVV